MIQSFIRHRHFVFQGNYPSSFSTHHRVVANATHRPRKFFGVIAQEVQDVSTAATPRARFAQSVNVDRCISMFMADSSLSEKISSKACFSSIPTNGERCFSTLSFSTTTSNEKLKSSAIDSSTTSSNESEDKNSSKSTGDKSKTNKDDSNIFLDNLGKIFLSSIGIILLMLIRSSKSNNSRLALRDDIESTSVLDPMEIDDLRVANSEFTIQVWNEIVEDVKREFPDGMATYPSFLSVVVRVMRRLKGEQFTIQMGHLVDRVVIAALENIGNENGFDGVMGRDAAKSDEIDTEKFLEKKLPLPFLFAALSLALNSTVSDRVRALYESMLLYPPQSESVVDSSSAQIDDNAKPATQSIASEEQASQMIQHLQNTCQLVSDAQIVETNSKVPYQTFRVGTGAELTERARKGYGGKKGAKGVTKEAEGPVSLEDFYAILKSRTVCAWGECYVKKVGRTATSDR